MQTSAESQLLWWLALATAVLVTIVVAALLALVLAVAGAIDDEATAIRMKAGRIAGSTIQLLYALRVNAAVGSIAGGAGLILDQAGRLVAHVQSCPACPDCRPGDDAPPAAPEHQTTGVAGGVGAEVPSTSIDLVGKRPAWSWN